MSHVALTVVAPLREGRRDEVRAAIDALGAGPDSPLARIPGMHMGRLTVVDRLADPRGVTAPAIGPLLVLTVDADGPEAAVLAALAPACGALLGACEGCPDPGDQRAFSAWVLRHRVKDRWTIMPYADRSLDEVRAALALRERLAAFAVRAASPADDGRSLRERFLAEFGGGRTLDRGRADG